MTQAATPQHLFAYGTLQPGGRYAHIAQNAGLKRSYKASITGFELYHLHPEGYPAVIQGNGRVHGTILEFHDWEKACPALDALEGCNLTPPEYRRMIVRTTETTQPVWLYVYANPGRLQQQGVTYLPDGYWEIQ